MRKNLKFFKIFFDPPFCRSFLPKTEKNPAHLREGLPLKSFPYFLTRLLGRHPPNKIPLGHNERTANYGISVESYSGNSRSAPTIKLRISPSAACNDGKRILPKIWDRFLKKGVKTCRNFSAAVRAVLFSPLSLCFDSVVQGFLGKKTSGFS